MSVTSAVVEGRLVALKRRDGTDVRLGGPSVSGSDLADEAALLTVAAHPGIVAIAELADTASTSVDLGDTLILVHAGERTWSTQPPATARLIANGVAALATTVADLHDLGVTHGQLDDPGHVIVGPGGQPVLCGFSRARFHPGSADTAVLQRRSDDVASLGRLVSLLLGRVPDGGRDDRGVSAALTALSVAAAGIAPVNGLSARDLARRAADAARVPSRAGGRSLAGLSTLRPGVTPWTLVAAVLMVTIGIVALAARRPGADVATSSVAPAATEPTTEPTTEPIPEPAMAPATVLTPSVAPTSTTAAELASDTDPAQPEPAVVLDVAEYGERYRVELETDAASAVGDWDCDGVRTLVVLDLATSALWAFDSWARPGRPIEGRYVSTVTGATGVEPAAALCPALLVETPAGLRGIEVAP